MPSGILTDRPSSLIYSYEERQRRDGTIWTTVQGVLAPVQFVVFLISLGLVLWFLASGQAYFAATVSIIVKTVLLLTIMVTGSIWEKVVFGKWLFAPAFFWEDVVSFAVIALHLAYLWALFTDEPATLQMIIALAAYTAYLVNAAQFLLKLRRARLEAAAQSSARSQSDREAAA